MTGPLDLVAFGAAVVAGFGILAVRRIHRHDWDTWQPLRHINYFEGGDDMPSSRGTVYVRHCRTCGKPKTKEVDT